MLFVIDCNVLVSAGLTDGVCRTVLRRLVAAHRGVLSKEILHEYRTVTQRPKFAARHSTFDRLIDLIQSVSDCIEVPPSAISLPDPDDEIYVAAALAAQADALITGNTAHFPDPTYGRTQVLTPRQFIGQHP